MKDLTQTPKVLNQAEAEIRQQKDKQELQAMLELAKTGNVDLQYELGHMYRTGERPGGQVLFVMTDNGVADYQSQSFQPDYSKAFFWLTKSAMNGDTEAENDLGFMYEHGEGISSYAEAAFDWYSKSAEKGFPPAQNNLARLYFLGQGTKVNYQLSYVWASIAFENGIAIAEEGIVASLQKLSEAQLEEAKNIGQKIQETLTHRKDKWTR